MKSIAWHQGGAIRPFLSRRDGCHLQPNWRQKSQSWIWNRSGFISILRSILRSWNHFETTLVPLILCSRTYFETAVVSKWIRECNFGNALQWCLKPLQFQNESEGTILAWNHCGFKMNPTPQLFPALLSFPLLPWRLKKIAWWRYLCYFLVPGVCLGFISRSLCLEENWA